MSPFDTASKGALFFDLDNLVASARRLYYAALKEIVSAQGKELTPVLFSRFFVTGNGADLPALYTELGLPADAADGIDGQIAETVTPRLAASTAKPDAALSAWIAAAQARGALVVAVTSLATDAAESLLARIGLNPEVIRISTMDEPGDNASWTKACASVGKLPRRCVAVVTSSDAAKAALAAHLGVVAVPDEYTDFQDFGGADAVLGSLKELDPKEYFDAIHF